MIDFEVRFYAVYRDSNGLKCMYELDLNVRSILFVGFVLRFLMALAGFLRFFFSSGI